MWERCGFFFVGAFPCLMALVWFDSVPGFQRGAIWCFVRMGRLEGAVVLGGGAVFSLPLGCRAQGVVALAPCAGVLVQRRAIEGALGCKDPCLGYVDVLLHSGQARVAQELLDDNQVFAAFDEVCGKRMAQGMHSHVRG